MTTLQEALNEAVETDAVTLLDHGDLQHRGTTKRRLLRFGQLSAGVAMVAMATAGFIMSADLRPPDIDLAAAPSGDLPATESSTQAVERGPSSKTYEQWRAQKQGGGDDAVATASPEQVHTLALPAAGEVESAFVGDAPVFVVRDPDGEVHVLDAVSPHDPRGMHKVVAWCRSSHLFEDLWHGSKFQADGTWVGGPAPTGLTAYRTTVVGDTIVVGAPYAAPARPGPDDPAGPEPDGPSCDERTQMGGVVDRGVLDDLLLHPKPPVDDGLVYPDEQSVLGVPVVTPS